MTAALPYWRLSGFYLFYFALLGAFLPYWPLFLRDAGYSALAIGGLVAIAHATKVVAPSLWGWLAARSGQRTRIIRTGSLLAMLIFAGVMIDHRFGWLALVVAGFSFFWNAVLAQFEVLTLSHLDGQYERYSRIRVWGSVGFIATVAGLGLVFDFISIRWLPVLMWLLLLAIWLSSLSVAERPGVFRPQPADSLLTVLKRPPVWAFLGACCLLQISHGPYYTFFSVYLEGLGYSATAIGLFWALGVAAEVALFLWMPRLLHRCTLTSIMVCSLGLAVLRWIVIGYWADHLALLLVAQCLHAVTFGSYHAYAVEMVRRLFADGHEGQGMALYSGLSFGGGGAIGALGAGWLWDWSASATFACAALAAALALLLGIWGAAQAARSDAPHSAHKAGIA